MDKLKLNESINGHYQLYACIVVSEEENDVGKIEVYVQERKGLPVIVYAVSRKQAQELSKIDIDLSRGDCHHLVARKFGDEINYYIKKGTDNEIKRKISDLREELEFSLVIYFPQLLHILNNRIFRGCFTPREVLKKLDNILYEGCFYNGNKKDLVDWLSVVAVFSKENCYLDAKEINKLKNSKENVIPANLIDYFQIKKEDIIEYLKNFFFYPNYKKFEKHFELLSEISHLLSKFPTGDSKDINSKEFQLDQHQRSSLFLRNLTISPLS